MDYSNWTKIWKNGLNITVSVFQFLRSVFQFFKICFPIFQDGFQFFKWVDMILCPGPVTGPVYTLAPALSYAQPDPDPFINTPGRGPALDNYWDAAPLAGAQFGLYKGG